MYRRSEKYEVKDELRKIAERGCGRRRYNLFPQVPSVALYEYLGVMAPQSLRR